VACIRGRHSRDSDWSLHPQGPALRLGFGFRGYRGDHSVLRRRGGPSRESQDFVGFLQTHDGDAVRLNAGFQVALDDFSVNGFGEARQASEEPGAAPWVRLYTECTPPLSGADQEQFDLGFRDELVIGRCMGDDLFVDGPDTDESGIYVIHGAPRIEGYFVVDIGDLHMGFTPTTLTPISFEEASERA